MKKTGAIALACLLTASALLTGCGQSGEGGDTSSASGSEYKSVGYVCAQLGDKSFNDLSWSGIQKAAQEIDLSAKCIEYGTDKAKMEPAVRDAAESYDIVVMNGNEFYEILDRIHTEYPDTKFIVTDLTPTTEINIPNVFAVMSKQHEGEFLAGALAQKMSKTGTVGLVAGADNTPINNFIIGYIQGSLEANPSGKVANSFIGGFTDTAKAKELALVQANQMNADVIHQVAGGAGLGVFEACKDEGIWGIGVDADQREFFIDTKPEIADVILTSMTKRNDITMAKAIKDTVDGTAEYGKLYKWGLKEGITVLAENDYYKAQVPQETQDYIGGLSDKIASGEIEVKMVYGMDQDEYVTFRDSVKP
ncbi:BMP family lipoprotein [Bittarella massiliensis (ex Durand et al. 2017)]|uniref:BMP family lipoprotein n=1 Tax=Bittarella massiliensis (ex Durand et al. 2017) TaxID=1720313 RepID=UPI001AA17ABE|nr:BMP family ABC transporter substrate-binding protein [Bittarella massiliensis (ex Durand et al. 2017)]MBO1679328.1 BMP family ABC transporter substrate-binding protein [Bittarella massiliensis (ex Durand et al. 2017)]